MDRLTTEWTEFYKTEDGTLVAGASFPPLLVMLENAVAASLGGAATGSKKAAWESSPVNLKALNDLNKIKTYVYDHCKKWGIRWHGLIQATVAYKKHVDALWRSKDIGESEYHALLDVLNLWDRQIYEMLIDKPWVRNLHKVPDPSANDRKWFTDPDGSRFPALVMRSIGEQLVVESRITGRQWVGKQLHELGRTIRVNADDQTLRDLGLERIG